MRLTLWMLAVPTLVLAQTNTGSITGTVLDLQNAGINTFGLQAADQFLDQTALLETTVVENTPSPPKVLATHFW